MGQRHQYIVVLPKKYLGKGNPNNKPKRAFIIHHQWLYGLGAISALDRVLRLAANMIEDQSTDYVFGRDKGGYSCDDTAVNAVAAAMSLDVDSGYYAGVHVYETDGRTDYYSPPKIDPDMLDNNDGVTLIEFEQGKATPKVCFITPSHLEGSYWNESDGLGPWTPSRYLGFYYNSNEREDWPEEDNIQIGKMILRINLNSRPMSLAAAKKLLPRFELGLKKYTDVVDQLNEGLTLETE